MTKNIKKNICILSIFTGLLLFTACVEHPDVFRAIETQADSRDLWQKYIAGGIGIYTRKLPSTVWTKQ